MNQEQRGGLGSHNFQVGTYIVTGSSYDDIKSIAKDVFDQNILQFAAEAKKVISERAEEIREEILQAFKSDGAAKPEAFKQPDMQSALFDAQKAYAMSGEEALKAALVSVITAASKEPSRSVRAIALQESIKILPLLTKNQISIIGINFITRHTKVLGTPSFSQLENYYNCHLKDILKDLSISRSDILHIGYTNCGHKSLGELSIPNLIRQAYPHLASNNDAELDINCRAAGPTLSALVEKFSSTEIKHLELTSVGVAIGHTIVNSFIRLSPLSTFL